MKRIIRKLGLLPNETTTEAGRSKERFRRAKITSASSLVAKAASVLTFIISVPLTVRYLGAERYGMWLTVASLVTMLACADLGIGNGLLNLICEAHGKDDAIAARRYVSSAFLLLSGIAAVLVAITLIALPFVNWSHFLNLTSPDAIRECRPTLLVLLGCFALNLPLGVTQRVLWGHQRGYVANLWAAFGSLLALGAVVAAIRIHASLPVLVLGIAGAPIVATFLSGVWLFVFSEPWLRPGIHSADMQSARRLFGMGLLFFVLQASLAVGFQTDNIVLAHVLGAGNVANYAITTRMFGFVPMLLTLVVQPLWPAYGEAYARGDVKWLKRTLKRSMLLVLGLAIPANALLIIAGKFILSIWVGPQLTVSVALLLAIGISQTLTAVTSTVAVFLNAIHVLKFQAICFASMAVTNIVASIYFTKHIGVPGVVCGSILAQVMFWIIPSLIFVPKLLRSLSDTPLCETSPPVEVLETDAKI